MMTKLPAWVPDDVRQAVNDFLRYGGNDNHLHVAYPPGVTSYREEAERIFDNCQMEKTVIDLRCRFHSRPAYKWCDFIKETLALMVYKGGQLPTLTVEEAKKERIKTAKAAARLRHVISLSKHPAIKRVSLADLLTEELLSNHQISIPRALFWLMNRVAFTDLLQALETKLDDLCVPLTHTDQNAIDRAPWIPQRPGNPQAQRLLLERALYNHFAVLEGDPADLVQTCTEIAFADEDSRETSYRKRSSAETNRLK